MNIAARPLPLTNGQFVVPGNRWDLLCSNDVQPVRVGVVIPYYEQPAQLALTLRALEMQDHPTDLLQVVVADDGSKIAPSVGSSRLDVTVVRQDDRGFRAAAARNLGAAATDADVLCFLDADTVPEPAFIGNLTRLASLLPDAVSVGRRRHADLSGWTPAVLERWWAGVARPRVLPEPRWLADAYDASADLLHVDQRSYRHVISAVMCCSRSLFDDIGGFDESFTDYGGEDWEFAHRALVGGGVLHHPRNAVAWHDGPDWADREVADRRAGKNREALAMARLIPDPEARRFGLRYSVPRVAVDLDTGGHDAGSLVTTLAGFLHEDVGVWLRGPNATALLDQVGAEDPRIRAGAVPETVIRRCHLRVTVSGRLGLPAEAFSDLLKTCGRDGVGEVRVARAGVGLVVRSSWAANRARRWTRGPVVLARAADAQHLAETVHLDADAVGLRCIDDVDLSW